VDRPLKSHELQQDNITFTDLTSETILDT